MTVTINGVDVSMIIDSGASCNIINTHTKNVLKESGIVFTNSNRTIHPYCSPPIKASVQATVTIGHSSSLLSSFYSKAKKECTDSTRY